MLNFQDIFETPKRSFISAFSICMTVPLKRLIGTNTIRNNKIVHTPKLTTTAGQCTQYYTSRSLCCRQFLKTTIFTNTQTREAFIIFHQVTCCHSNYVIYLLECVMCKIQKYVGKSETSFKIRLNNRWKDMKYQTP